MSSAADELEFFYRHTVTVNTLTGEGAYGAIYAPTSEPINGLLDDKRQLVRNQAGDQIVSEATFWTTPANAAHFTPESIVHLPDRDATVISRKVSDLPDEDFPDHAEIILT